MKTNILLVIVFLIGTCQIAESKLLNSDIYAGFYETFIGYSGKIAHEVDPDIFIDLKGTICSRGPEKSIEEVERWKKSIGLAWLCSPVLHAYVVGKLARATHAKSIDRYRKHAIWYSPIFDAAHIIFPAVDYAVGYGFKKINEKYSDIAVVLPVNYRDFVLENGHLVISAGITRAIANSAKNNGDGISYENGRLFAIDATTQISRNAIDTFFITPGVKMIANEGDVSYVLLDFVANMLAAKAVAFLVNSIVGAQER